MADKARIDTSPQGNFHYSNCGMKGKPVGCGCLARAARRLREAEAETARLREALERIKEITEVDGSGQWAFSGFGASVFDRIANSHNEARAALSPDPSTPEGTE